MLQITKFIPEIPSPVTPTTPTASTAVSAFLWTHFLPPCLFCREEEKNVSWRSFKTLWHTLTFFFNFSGNIYIHSFRLSAYFALKIFFVPARVSGRSGEALFIQFVLIGLSLCSRSPPAQHFHGLLSRKIFTPRRSRSKSYPEIYHFKSK